MVPIHAVTMLPAMFQRTALSIWVVLNRYAMAAHMCHLECNSVAAIT